MPKSGRFHNHLTGLSIALLVGLAFFAVAVVSANPFALHAGSVLSPGGSHSSGGLLTSAPSPTHSAFSGSDDDYRQGNFTGDS